MIYFFWALSLAATAAIVFKLMSQKASQQIQNIQLTHDKSTQQFEAEIARQNQHILKIQDQNTLNTKENLSLISSTLEDSANSADSSSLELETIINGFTQLADSLTEINEISYQTKTSAEVGISNIGKVDKQLSELANSKQQLELILQKFEEISEKTSAIRYIGEEAEMLALNAAIEAARAGDAGRGFAVVATNMKELSKKSQESSSEIHSIVEQSGRVITTLTNEFNNVTGSLTHSIEALTSNFTKISEDIANIEHRASILDDESHKQMSLAQSVSTSVKTSVETLVARLSKLVSMLTGKEITDISPQQAKEQWDTFDEVIDVRREKEWNDELGHIPDITFSTLQTDFKQKVSELAPEKTYLFVCRSGGRSTKAAQMAMTNGIAKVYNLEGGMLAWRKAGL